MGLLASAVVLTAAAGASAAPAGRTQHRLAPVRKAPTPAAKAPVQVPVATPAAAPAPGARNSSSGLNLPQNPTLFGAGIPSVVKASAIVNGEVITQTDIDQRLALLAIANGQPIPADQLETLRTQVLRNLIDETLQIQAAKAEKIDVSNDDIDKTVKRVASGVKQTPEQMADYLKARGSSIRSIRRQIEGELAWQRLQRQKIENSVNVGDDEVKAVIARMNAAKGTEEFHVGEIYLSANQGNDAQVQANMAKILDALKQGGSFVGYARQFSEASTAAVGGDLGWVRPEMLPEQLSAVLRTMGPGQISAPVKVQGGYSILAVQDTRKVLTADPRDAVLALKQISISFPKGTSPTAAEPVLQRFAAAAQGSGGCGGADKIAADFHGDVVTSDGVKLRDLPPALQQMMTPMQVGQATRPFGSIEDGVRVLVICGRDEGQSDTEAPTYDKVFAQLNEERVNLRSRRYLRDLRRDAVIEFR
ncbi:peptidylprolyl isomerase [Sphingomonas ginkgonis]|uniref:peptidylprolyl isomerase n=1 Tax=Sphingomonas ginkgonis TaxID=2315330 RepID=UPI001EF12AA9|nr:peptidylprolyl isomerase [Sphingomonas ginkgonis]